MKDINLFKTKDSLFLREVSSKEEALQYLNCDGFLIKASEKTARSIIASLKDKKLHKLLAFQGGDDAFNRRAIETLDINYLISPEGSKKIDNLKQRDSGLNHVTAKAAAKKGIKILVDLSEISRLEKKEKSLRISRIIQNIKICRKASCNIRIVSLAKNKKEVVDELGRKSFGTSLGMSSSEVRDCAEF